MEISLNADLKQFVEQSVQTGHFQSINEVIENALQLMRDQESLSADDLEDLRREVAIGIDQADRGEFVEFDAEQIKIEGRAKLYPGRSS